MSKICLFLLIIKSIFTGAVLADVCCPGCRWFYENGDETKLAYCYYSQGTYYVYRDCKPCDVTSCNPGVPDQCQGKTTSKCPPPCQRTEKEIQRLQKHQHSIGGKNKTRRD